MSDANLERDPELESMISGERAIPSPTPGQLDRVWRKLELVLPPAEPIPTPEPTAGAAMAKGFAAKAVLSGVSAIVGGVIALATERQVVDHTVPQQAPTAVVSAPTAAERVAPAPMPAAPPATNTVPEATPRTATRERATVVTPEAGPSSAGETGLHEEQSWIATMRAGLVRREFDEVTRRARAYHQRFPEGQLREDCDALALLAGLTRDPQSSTTADVDQFLVRYPSSLYRAAIVRAQQGAQH